MDQVEEVRLEVDEAEVPLVVEDHNEIEFVDPQPPRGDLLEFQLLPLGVILDGVKYLQGQNSLGRVLWHEHNFVLDVDSDDGGN